MRQSFYIGVKGIIEQAGKVLILKDSPRSKWELPGGRIDANQSIEEAVSRELAEEIPGAKLTKLGPIVHAATGDFTVENEHRLCLIFFKAKATLPNDIALSHEHLEHAWVDQKTYQKYDLFTSDAAALTQFFKGN